MSTILLVALIITFLIPFSCENDANVILKKWIFGLFTQKTQNVTY